MSLNLGKVFGDVGVLCRNESKLEIDSLQWLRMTSGYWGGSKLPKYGSFGPFYTTGGLLLSKHLF